MAPIILGYWNIRGLIQPTRLLLEYAGAEWEDKLYAFGPAPGFSTDSWLVEKETLGLDFPNLPWMKDGNIKLTQSEAILRYVARKFKLDGQTEQEKHRADLVGAEISDIWSSFHGLCYNPDFASVKPEFLKTLAPKLQRVLKFLGDSPYFAGNNITFADFWVYEVLEQLKVLEPTVLTNCKNLEEFQKRIEKLDAVAAFIKSKKFIKYPLNGAKATFGGN